MRIKITSIIIIVVFSFLLLALLKVEVIGANKFKELSDKNCIRLLPQEGCRGKILDRQGEIIVDNSLSYDLMALFGYGTEFKETLEEVGRILGKNLDELKTKSGRAAGLPFIPVSIAQNIDIRDAFKLEELKSELPGIIIQPRLKRNYPHQKLACHVLGHLGEIDRWRLTKLADYGYKTKDTVGFGGLEEKYDYYLRQEEGGLSVEVDHRARFTRLLGFRPARSGKDIRLTIDIRIQEIVETALEGRNGAVVIMDPNDGKILALASSPNFNPETFVRKDNYAISQVLNDPDSPLLNRAIAASFPAGSVFKLMVAAAALETGKINSSTSFYCPGSMNLGRQEFACWNTHHQQNLKQAVTHSCNVFFYRTGLLIGAGLIHDYALKFGFGKTTSVDLPYEVSGSVPSPFLKKMYEFKKWYDGDTVNLSIGQGGLLVTPLQIARMMAVFANNGFLVTPYLVKEVEGNDLSRYRKKITRVGIKANTLEIIRQALKDVVSDPEGTANVLSGLSVQVAGKTGTAQVARRQPHAWFTGFFPYKNPKFVICVFLENAGPGYFSCLVTKQIIEEMSKEGLI